MRKSPESMILQWIAFFFLKKPIYCKVVHNYPPSQILPAVITTFHYSDGDGIPNDYDNCKDLPNADQTDTDSDGKGWFYFPNYLREEIYGMFFNGIIGLNWQKLKHQNSISMKV